MAEIKSEKELNALISMIDEPSEKVFAAIRQKIADYGRDAIPVLEDAWMNSFSEEQNERLERLIGDIRFSDLYAELQKWKQFNQDDLLAAFVIICRFRYPDFDEEKYLVQLARLKQDAWLEMNDELTALEKTKVLNHIFYDVWGFRGISPQHKITINSYFLNEVLDTKKGNALSLGIIYISLAQHLNIPVFGVDLPRHFVLTYLEDASPVKVAQGYNKDEILFYINAMNKGAVFTTNEVDLYIQRMKLEAQDSYYLPCSNLTIVRRLIAELISAYKSEHESEKVTDLEELLAVLDS
jgi:regulator of sirC expression with transglutaminase-like and TPR domain